MAREMTRGGYSILGALAGLAGILSVGAASVSVQLDGVIWWLLAAVFAAAAAGFFWLSVRLLMRGRVHPPGEPGGGRRAT
jgi:drug/metabolite transporter (DMT)-like permease